MFQVLRYTIALECTTATSVVCCLCFSHSAACSFMVYFIRVTNLTPLWDQSSLSFLVLLSWMVRHSFSAEKTYPFHSSFCSIITDAPLSEESTCENHEYLKAKGSTISYQCSWAQSCVEQRQSFLVFSSKYCAKVSTVNHNTQCWQVGCHAVFFFPCWEQMIQSFNILADSFEWICLWWAQTRRSDPRIWSSPAFYEVPVVLFSTQSWFCYQVILYLQFLKFWRLCLM